MSSDGDDALTRQLRLVEQWDPIEEQQAYSEVAAALFDASAGPVTLGRYLLLSRIGRGGGGIVYGAYDPELHRRVAVKIVRPSAKEAERAEDRDRLLAEAQAVASLSHPHIVAVYDVGPIPPGHPHFARGVFMVMELVEGENVSQWLSAEAHGWREVLDALVPVGHALAAAHRANVVHRDVKPANVLLGRDGRPRLVDFGLARALPGDRAGPRVEDGTTDTLGTPGYMAPEQHTGEKADPRTDQYGYCATLYAALHGRRPFSGDSLDELLAAKKAGPPPRVRKGVPRWLDDAIARGLAPDRADRFADMDALLAVLERGRNRIHRATVLAVTSIGIAATVAIVAFRLSDDRAAACREQGERRAEEVWSTERRDAAISGVLATAQPWSADVARVAGEAVDGHLARWRDAHGQACEQAVGGETQAGLVAERLACLDRALDEVDELASLMADADAELVQGSVNASRQLTPPDACEREAADPPDDERSRELDLRLRRGRVRHAAGNYAGAASIAGEVAAAAREIGDHVVEARAHLLACNIAVASAKTAQAERECEAAVIAADRGGAHELAVEVMAELVRLVEDADEAERLYRLAEARFDGMAGQDRDDVVRVDLAFALGNLRQRQKRHAEAIEALEHGLALAEELHGSDHPILAGPLNALALAYADRGQLERAAAAHERGIELTRRGWGDHHPTVGALLTNLAGIELSRGRDEEALALAERALAIKTAAFGESEPRLVSTLDRMAQALTRLGRGEEAVQAASRSLAIERARFGDDHREVAGSQVVLAATLRAAGRCDEALALLDRAASTFARAKIEHVSSAVLPYERGLCLVARGDGDDVRAAFAEALERHEKSAKPRARVDPLLALGEWYARHGRVEEARAAFVQAQKVCTNTEGDPRQLERATAGLDGLL